jgi:hypothetical protein
MRNSIKEIFINNENVCFSKEYNSVLRFLKIESLNEIILKENNKRMNIFDLKY